jgi:hypothetical protein
VRGYLFLAVASEDSHIVGAEKVGKFFVLGIRKGLERRRVPTLSPSLEHPLDSFYSNVGLTRPGRGGHENIGCIESLERFHLERVGDKRLRLREP